MSEKISSLLCPSCQQPFIVHQTPTNEQKLKRNTKRSTFKCSACGLSVKEAILKKFAKPSFS